MGKKGKTNVALIDRLTCDLCRRKDQPGVAYDRGGKPHARFCHGCIFTLARAYERLSQERLRRLISKQ